MIDMHLEIVRSALALHLEVDSREIDVKDRLDADLGLDPLDLVLVALRLEEIEQGEFPVARLETATTVADLVAVVRAWSAMPGTAEERETLLPPETPPARTSLGDAPCGNGVSRGAAVQGSIAWRTLDSSAIENGSWMKGTLPPSTT